MDNDYDINSDLCFWVTGHSMGAGVANIVVAELLHGASGINNRTDNVYCYTFAAPNTFYITDNTNTRPNRALPNQTITETYRDPHSIKYRCIFNVVNADDFVPKLPMEDCGWTKYGRTAPISFNGNKKQIENVVRSESKYDLLHYKWTNTNRFINETYKGNTQTIRDIVKSFDSIFEDDPKNMRHDAYKFDSNDYILSKRYYIDPVQVYARPYQKVAYKDNTTVRLQTPAYFMQTVASCMHTKDYNGNKVFEIPGVANLNQMDFAIANLNKRYNNIKVKLINASTEKNIVYPHYLESYYFLTKQITVNTFDR